MKVYINKHDSKGKIIGRKIVNAELVQDRPGSVLVKLPDGNLIVRRKNRDIPDVGLQQSENKE